MVVDSGDVDDPAGANIMEVEAELRVLKYMMLSAGNGVLAEGSPEDWVDAVEMTFDKDAVEEAALSGGGRAADDWAELDGVPDAAALPFGEDEGVAEA
jgi:hypothetical protein